jgi:hypothetical protein
MSAFHLTLTVQLISFALFLQTIEYLKIRQSMSDSGVWSWRILCDEFAAFPRWIRWILDSLLLYPNVIYLLAFQMALTLIFFMGFWFPLIPVSLFFTSTLMSVRFRGNFNGGADYMTSIVLAALIIAQSFSKFQEVALYYIAVQACLSYFIAGLSKIRRQDWRSGEALRGFLSTTNYDIPPLARELAKNHRLILLCSWLVMIFECLYPFALLNQTATTLILVFGLLFHLANFYVFGLNRFVFAWLATYPALYFVNQALALKR